MTFDKQVEKAKEEVVKLEVLGIISIWPMDKLLEVKLLVLFIFSTVVSYLLAISHKLSPFFANNQTIVIDYGYVGNASDANFLKNNYEALGEAVVKSIAEQ